MPVYALGDQVPQIDPSAFIHPDAVIIGDVRIGAESSVWACAVLRGDDGPIHIGSGSSIQDGAVLHTTSFSPTTVGDGCTIGHLAHLEGCVIKDGGLVGSGAIVLHEAVVGEFALVAAGAVVLGKTEVPPGALAVGTPARIKPDAANRKMIETGAQSYVERAGLYKEHLRRID